MNSDRTKRLIEAYKKKHGKEPTKETIAFFESGEPTPFPKNKKELNALLKKSKKE